MKIYVIDTARADTWRTAFPDSSEVIVNPGIPLGFTEDDFVFAHTHETPVDANSDLVLEGPNGASVNAVCKALTASASVGIVPTIVFYSGDRITNARGNRWRGLAVAQNGPLGDYPTERIITLSDPIGRDIQNQYLHDLITGCIDRIRQQERAPQQAAGADIAVVTEPADSRAISVADTLRRNEEALLAARLIVEAMRHCGDSKSVELEGITIHAPSKELGVLAESLLETSKRGEVINKPLEEFISALRRGNTQQP